MEVYTQPTVEIVVLGINEDIMTGDNDTSTVMPL